MRKISAFWMFATLAMAADAPLAVTTRLKDLVTLEGVRDNQLVGYGLVVGLAGTGDRRQTMFSAQSLANILERMGISVPGASIRVSNTAAVMLTATLPPFAQPGTRIDITAAAIGDCTNLQGGLLLLTPLKGPDGNIYAAAQGAVVTGGFVAGKGGGNSQTVNHPTVGRVPAGAIVEKAAPSIPPSGKVRLQLRQADFSTSARVAQVINDRYGSKEKPVAFAENSAVVRVELPAKFKDAAVGFVAELESLQVAVDGVARVIINERTGTIVMGRDVHIAPVTIMQGGLTVEVRTVPQVSQPEPLSQGSTQVVQQTTTAREEKARNLVLKQGASVEELVRALNAIGSTPRDIIAILQALRSAGALDAAVEVI